MLTQDQVSEFHTAGYLKSKRILDDTEVAEMQNEIERVIRDKDTTGVTQPVLLGNMSAAETPVWQIVNIWEASPPFKKLLYNQTINEEMAQLTGQSVLRIWHDQIQYKPMSTGGTNMWHQDAPLWPILSPMTEVSAWVALDDVDPENGCMSMVPGSHLWGNHMDMLARLQGWEAMPSEFEGHAIEVKPCPVKKGEVHYHHALTWHGSPQNRSGRARRAIALHFMSNETKYVSSGEHVMKRFVNVADGETVSGDHFPVTWPQS